MLEAVSVAVRADESAWSSSTSFCKRPRRSEAFGAVEVGLGSSLLGAPASVRFIKLANESLRARAVRARAVLVVDAVPWGKGTVGNTTKEFMAQRRAWRCHGHKPLEHQTCHDSGSHQTPRIPIRPVVGGAIVTAHLPPRGKGWLSDKPGQVDGRFVVRFDKAFDEVCDKGRESFA